MQTTILKIAGAAICCLSLAACNWSNNGTASNAPGAASAVKTAKPGGASEPHAKGGGTANTANAAGNGTAVGASTNTAAGGAGGANAGAAPRVATTGAGNGAGARAGALSSSTPPAPAKGGYVTNQQENTRASGAAGAPGGLSKP